MARTRSFRDLQAWQKSMQLARNVYRLTETFPKTEMFGLLTQMRRAAVSVPSNIAEGHGRLSDNSFRVFLAQARGSLFELETQIQLALDLGYISTNDAEEITEFCREVGRILNGLIRATNAGVAASPSR